MLYVVLNLLYISTMPYSTPFWTEQSTSWLSLPPFFIINKVYGHTNLLRIQLWLQQYLVWTTHCFGCVVFSSINWVLDISRNCAPPFSDQTKQQRVTLQGSAMSVINQTERDILNNQNAGAACRREHHCHNSLANVHIISQEAKIVHALH
jgi:hypothetical protein